MDAVQPSPADVDPASPAGAKRPERVPASPVGLSLGVYASFFLSGATALVFEMLWSRQFVTVFGNSSYAISVVLCAYMAGLGLGSWLGGRLADRLARRLLAYGAAQAGVALWALGIPLALEGLRRAAPHLPFLSVDSSVGPGVGRFLLSFGILLVPCLLMGATLPLLARHCVESRQAVGRKVGLLYGLNTLGAAVGCFAAGFWMLSALGLSATNDLAVCVNLMIAAACAAWEWLKGRGAPQAAAAGQASEQPAVPPSEDEARAPAGRRLLFAVAFASGVLSLSCEVLWVRHLSFASSIVYAFTIMLGIFLLGQAVGSVFYRFVLVRLNRPILVLAWLELLVGLSIGACLIGGVLLFAAQNAGTGSFALLAAITTFVPALLMGAAFPLICAAYVGPLASAGRGVGTVYAANTAGAIFGSLLPVFVFIPCLGIEPSLLLSALAYSAIGVALLAPAGGRRRFHVVAAGTAVALGAAAVAALVPQDLGQRLFLATDPDLGRHNEIVFYREGKTGTAIIARDKVDGLDRLYINAAGEVPTTYSAMSCFRLLGSLGPLLHPHPDRVLMVSLGGGIAAGAAAQFPSLGSLQVVDLESSVVEAARTLEAQNNGVLHNPKVRVMIDDGRNFTMMSREKWPVIVSDSTHPKAPDSWVLYTREFYETVKERLADDGVFVQWLPLHDLSLTEYKIIVRTFQSVFSHASLWFSHGVDETGQDVGFTLMVATPVRLAVDAEAVRHKLSAPAVRDNLRPVGMDQPVGVFECFLFGEETMQRWTGPGPINTDDLPYTQYKTRYSRGQSALLAVFVPDMESLWPYLHGTGDAEQSRRLEQALAQHVAANRLALGGWTDRALAVVPDDPKLLTCSENLARGRGYLRALAQHYQDDPYKLAWLARRAEELAGGQPEAVAFYERALALQPDSAGLHTALGVLLARRGESESGLTHLRRALELDPGSAEAHNNAGLVLNTLGRPQEAMAHYRAALLAEPSSCASHCNLGMALAAAGKRADARAHFDDALRLAPEAPDVLHALGVFLAQEGRLSEAEADLRAALRVWPNYGAAHYDLACVLSRTARLEEAAEEFAMATWADPNDAAAREGLRSVREILRRRSASAPSQVGGPPPASREQ
jgi:spermidine synthase